jgi:hypothetical protein
MPDDQLNSAHYLLAALAFWTRSTNVELLCALHSSYS